MKPSKNMSLTFIIGIMLLIIMFCIAMVFGAAETSIRDVWQALFTNKSSDQ